MTLLPRRSLWPPLVSFFFSLPKLFFLRELFFSLHGICLFIIWPLPLSESFRDLGIGLLCSLNLPSILNITGHRVSSELLFKEIYQLPKTLRICHQLSETSISQTVSITRVRQHHPESKEMTKSCCWACSSLVSEPPAALHQREHWAEEVPRTTCQL